MKKLLILTSMIIAITFLQAMPKGFTDNFDSSIEEAKKSNKLMLTVFSGSDWCYWCKVLDSNYLSKSEFISELEKDFILVFIDTPRNRSLYTVRTLKRNPELVEKYKIQSFPTLLFIDGKGKATEAPRPEGEISPKEYAKLLKDAALKIKSDSKKK